MSDATALIAARPRTGLTLYRLAWVIGLATALGLFFGLISSAPVWKMLVRTLSVALIAMVGFSLAEVWPKRMPFGLPRWPWQILASVLLIPPVSFCAYALTIGNWAFVPRERELAMAWAFFTFLHVLGVPWVALAAMLRQRDAFLSFERHQFEVQKSELERSATQAQLNLLQTQVQPHFLFNTLANVRALVASGSQQAAPMLDSLIAYLRSAVPRTGQEACTVAHEFERVRAYLALMQLRMPDRLSFSVEADARAQALPCPPMAALTLVENAIRHGIDPGEGAGSIDVSAAVYPSAQGQRLLIRVTDSGHTPLPHAPSTQGLGTGLAQLRERLRLAHGDAAELRTSRIAPQGFCAEIELPLGTKP